MAICTKTIPIAMNAVAIIGTVTSRSRVGTQKPCRWGSTSSPAAKPMVVSATTTPFLATRSSRRPAGTRVAPLMTAWMASR